MAAIEHEKSYLKLEDILNAIKLSLVSAKCHPISSGQTYTPLTSVMPFSSNIDLNASIDR